MFYKVENQLNGLSPNGLLKGSSAPLLPPPLEPGGFPGVVLIIISETELSRIILITSGLLYDFLDNIV